MYKLDDDEHDDEDEDDDDDEDDEFIMVFDEGNSDGTDKDKLDSWDTSLLF
jgi:hypothetical protein